MQGVGADVGIFSIERDVERLAQKAAGHVELEGARRISGIVNKTPFVILVRKGNPKGIRDFADLAKPGVKLIHPDPVSSGGAQWSILAIYGSELKKSEAESGGADQARALQLLQVRLAQRHLDAGLGARGAHAVRDRLRRRAHHVRAGRAC